MASLAIMLMMPALAVDAKPLREGGKLMLTDGIATVEGSSGGGLASWATIAGRETDAGIGATAHLTYVPLTDYRLTSYGAAIGLFDRVELSYARQRFDTRAMGAQLGLGRNFSFHQDIFAAKLRIAGDLVADQDRLLPQIAIGVQHKRADRVAVIGAIGGQAARGTDFTLAATKLILRHSLLIDVTARLTKANQLGLLGFGGAGRNDRSLQVEGSAAWLASRRLAIGVELRSKPDNLAFATERAAWDLFAAWAVDRNVTLTAAYVDLGAIATRPDQRGALLSIQTGF